MRKISPRDTLAGQEVCTPRGRAYLLVYVSLTLYRSVNRLQPSLFDRKTLLVFLAALLFFLTLALTEKGSHGARWWLWMEVGKALS